MKRSWVNRGWFDTLWTRRKRGEGERRGREVLDKKEDESPTDGDSGMKATCVRDEGTDQAVVALHEEAIETFEENTFEEDTGEN